MKFGEPSFPLQLRYPYKSCAFTGSKAKKTEKLNFKDLKQISKAELLNKLSLAKFNKTPGHS